MKTKSRSYSTIQAKNISKETKASAVINKIKKLNTSSKQPVDVKESQKKIKRNEKQNVESGNIPSPQQKLKNKNFKPKIRKNSKLELESTVSLIVNESITSVKNQDILDSLLYGEVDLTYSQDFHQKDQQSEELLISGCEQNVQRINFKNCKSLSPIKSISQYSITESAYQKFVIQKIQNEQANCIMKVRNKTSSICSNKVVQSCVVARRLVIMFNENKQKMLNFFCSIHKACSKEDLSLKVRQYLFQSGVIFKKCELTQFIDALCSTIKSINEGSHKSQFCEENMQIMIESIFLSRQPSQQLLVQFWLLQQVYDKIFEEGDLVSIWKLIVQLFYEAPQQIESSFKQSRFCMSAESNKFFHESDQKRKKQNILTVQDWLKHFLTPEPDLQGEKLVTEEETQIKIKITPPL